MSRHLLDIDLRSISNSNDLAEKMFLYLNEAAKRTIDEGKKLALIHD